MPRRTSSQHWRRLVVVITGCVAFSAALAQEMDHAEHMHAMPGLLGSYSMTQEASGTSWQPQSTPMPSPSIHLMPGEWMVMGHGSAYFIYDHAGGDRGGDKWMSTNMLM